MTLVRWLLAVSLLTLAPAPTPEASNLAQMLSRRALLLETEAHQEQLEAALRRGRRAARLARRAGASAEAARGEGDKSRAAMKQVAARVRTLVGLGLRLRRRLAVDSALGGRDLQEHLRAERLARSFLGQATRTWRTHADRARAFEELAGAWESIATRAQMDMTASREAAESLREALDAARGRLDASKPAASAMAARSEAPAMEAELRRLESWVAGRGHLPKKRGALLWPVRPVRITRAFGAAPRPDAAGIALLTRGMVLAPIRQAGKEAPRVVAPATGRVQVAEVLRGLGGVVVLDHGGGLRTVAAGLRAIDVRPGQLVGRGEPLGSMPRSSKARLHFQLWRGTEPLDPRPYLP